MSHGSPSKAAAQALRLSRPSLPSLTAYTELLETTWDDGWLSNFGPHGRRFEGACAGYTGLSHVRAVANCDIGLALAVRALGIPPGARVIVPSFTFPSTLHALLWNGLEPRFADVDPDTWCLTAESAAPAVDAATRAIVGTHSFMSVCDVDGLERLAGDAGATLLFDAAQAFASWIGERHVGTYGDASVFSFSPTKIATCGEGGLAAFRDPAHAERFEALRSYGSDDGELVGLNARLSEPHAALGCLTVEDVEEEVARRARLADRYRERLASLPGVRLQAGTSELRPTPTLLVADLGSARAPVAAALAAEGIETRRYFTPLHTQPGFAGIAAAPLPVSERLGDGALALPLHGQLDEADVDRVCDAVGLAISG
ncbi:MAG TPA: DegT/DnrJ/EryC1/StrS family aminotransferase [Thermoleophilaceae bacterium]